MFTIGLTVSTSDGDQVKSAGKDYMDNRIYSYKIICSYTVNVNLMLISVELLEIWSFIVKYASKFSVFEVIYYVFFCNILFCQSIPP